MLPENTFAQRIVLDQVSRFIIQAITGILATLLLSSLFTFLVWDEAPRNRLVAWWSIAVAVSLVRLVLHLFCRKMALTNDNVHTVRNVLLVFVFLAGCVWGLSALLLFNASSTGNQAVLILVIGGMIAGSVNVFASISGSFYCFLLPAVTPITLILFTSFDRMHVTMGLMLLFFSSFMCIANKSINTDIYNFLLLKYKNLDLISKLEREIVEKNEAENRLQLRNQQIEQIVEERTTELQEANGRLLTEIKERIVAETALRESEERFRILHNASFGGIAIHDHGMILDCNQGLARISGYTLEEMIGFDGLKLIAPDWRPKVTAYIHSDYDTICEAEGLRKNGERYPLALRGKNIPYKGRTAQIIEFRDITDLRKAEEARKKLQAQLIHNQKIQAIGTLAGGFAHYFNNILGAVLGFAEIARGYSESGSTVAINLDKVLVSGQRAADLVKHILAFSKQIDVDRLPLNPVPFVEKALTIIRPTVSPIITLTHHLEPASRPVLANPDHIRQIVINLATNALQAMEQNGGVLDITTRECELSSDDLANHPEVLPGHFFMLTVRDTGPGIAPEIFDRIYEPFFTTREVGKGTGMGLAITHGIVSSYGGFIIGENGSQGGTVFRVFIPALALENRAETAGGDR